MSERPLETFSEGTDGQPQSPSPRSERPAGTPAPQYGELAPEGWSWQPEQTTAQPSAHSASSTASAGAPSSGQVPGVPHNLGVSAGGPRPAQPSAAPQDYAPRSSSPQGQQPTDRAGAQVSYRATQPPTSAPPRAPHAPRQGNTADRVITIILLVLGALGAMYTAFSLYQMRASLNLLATTLEIQNVVIPAAVGTVGSIGALVILAIYAINLIYSLQRLRARKITFWVPLAAGIIAFIVLFVFSMIALAQAPELMQQLEQQLSDPATTSKLFDSLASQSQ